MVIGEEGDDRRPTKGGREDMEREKSTAPFAWVAAKFFVARQNGGGRRILFLQVHNKKP